MDYVQTEEGPNHDPTPARRGLQRHYIGGIFRESQDGATFETLNPANNEPLAEAADGKEADVDAAVRAARRAFDDGPWPHLRATQRAAALRRIAGAIREHAEEFIELEVLDIGMPIAQMKGLAARRPTTSTTTPASSRSCTATPTRSATSS